jgi:uncharacterized SAM-binding protein YcdF (DUF218 family)
VLFLAAVVGLVFLALRNAGNWLVVADPLQRARAVVVLSGRAPFRAMGAADLYHKGWAPAIWITNSYERGASEAYARVGVRYTPESDYSQQVLEKLGVPEDAIQILPTSIHNTAEEIDAVAAMLRRVGGGCVIFVTSPLHARRVKTIWKVRVGNQGQAIVRYESYEKVDPARWWRTTGDADEVVHELLGLLNVRVGFLAKPRE